jgi:hypothetical protein
MSTEEVGECEDDRGSGGMRRGVGRVGGEEGEYLGSRRSGRRIQREQGRRVQREWEMGGRYKGDVTVGGYRGRGNG